MVAVELGGDGKEFIVSSGDFLHSFVVLFQADVKVPQAVRAEFPTGGSQCSLE